MPTSVFQNENVAVGLPANSQFQAGVSDYDPGTNVEQGVKIPWAANVPDANWDYYDNVLECFLDSGVAVHRHLPQSAPSKFVTLASGFVDNANLAKMTGAGTNTATSESYSDTVQQMAHSVYRFHLYGEAIRYGQQIPIPGLKTVCGVPAVPDDENPQRAFNRIASNNSGVIVWHAKWDLWYTVAQPPTMQVVPPDNLAAHIGTAAPIPPAMQVPFSSPDANAQRINPRGAP